MKKFLTLLTIALLSGCNVYPEAKKEHISEVTETIETLEVVDNEVVKDVVGELITCLDEGYPQNYCEDLSNESL